MGKFLRLLLAGLLVLIAACSSIPEHDSEQEKKTETEDILLRPLQVPGLASLPESPERSLKTKFIPVSYAALPGWENESFNALWQVFINNCKGLMRPVGKSLTRAPWASPRAWQPVCLAAQKLNAAGSAPTSNKIRQFIETHLQVWRVANEKGQAAKNTVTGYYEPGVKASRTRQGAYQWPLYAVPADLLTIDLGSLYPELAGKRIRGKLVGKRVVPYDTRAEIAASEGRQPKPIVWVNDAIDAFFLQIQGSGRAQLKEGGTIRLAYADHNGHPYVSIGQWLVKQGEMTLAQASMANIKAWARNNPDRVQSLLNVNPAMVFFREETVADENLGPKGAYGIALSEKRSIAVDPSYVPLGSPVFLSTTYPASQALLQGLVFAQDTGAAIKGAARADFYWGYGPEAGSQAGKMKQSGDMWVLWPKQAGVPSAR